MYDSVSKLMKLGKWRQAIEFLEAEEVTAQEFRLSWSLGWCYFKVEELAAAARWLERATEIDSNQAIGFWALGVSLQEAGRLEDAALALETCLQVRDSPLPRMSLGIIYRELGQPDKAERLYREGLTRFPTSARMHGIMADYLSDIGRPEEAVRFYDAERQLQREN